MPYQENDSNLSAQTRDLHRAIDSLREELEAIDLYNQRADVVSDKDLKALLIHNRDEEKEHAAMLFEWLRRHDPELAKKAKEWVFTDKAFNHD
ncbi:MAG: ferritin [Alphaproteobacteria bacterium]|nr:ferritin [Alphaproteobacteria bacterium]